MASRFLPENPRTRSAVVAAGVVLFAALYTQLLVPGAGGARGTPMALLYSGLVAGMLNALTAVGIILVYRTSRVINFAQTAIGAAGGQLTFQFLTLTKVPFVLALLLGLLLSALIGLVFELVIVRRFFRSPRLILTVATIAAAELIATIGPSAVNGLPFFPKVRDPLANLGVLTLRSRLPYPGWHYKIGHYSLQFGFAEAFAIETALLALLLIAAFFRFTRAGVAVRAMAENTERASLLGINVASLSLIVWTLAGFLSGVGVILTGLVTQPGSALGVAPGILLPALAAAVVARMRSIPVAVGASIGISMLTSASLNSFRQDGPLIPVALFLVVTIGLLLQRRTILRSEDSGGVSWEATEEQRPVPKELRSIGGIRLARYALAAVGILGLLAYPFLTSTGVTNLGGVIAITGILALSLVVLTGWAGQVSLGQYGFMAVGAVIGGSLVSRANFPFWIAAPIATVATGAFAIAVGIPALRIKGLFLAVTTFAFAVAIDAALFSPRYFGWILPKAIKRPTFFFLNFDDEKSMYFLCVACLVLAIILVLNLRRTRMGRILIAVRENEANLQSFGVAAQRAKLTAFAIAGGLCGFAGALFAVQQRGISALSFDPQRSIDLFLLAVLGGVTSTGGVLLGAAYFSSQQYFLSGNVVWASIQPFAVLMLLYAAPGGLISLVNQVRDSVLRIVAQRRQLIVPSLFADYDPEALERRLIPLGDPADATGLAGLPIEQRYAIASDLYTGKGRITEKRAPAKTTVDAAAIPGAGGLDVDDSMGS